MTLILAARIRPYTVAALLMFTACSTTSNFTGEAINATPPGAEISVQLISGRSVEGTLVEVSERVLVVRSVSGAEHSIDRSLVSAVRETKGSGSKTAILAISILMVPVLVLWALVVPGSGT